MTQKRNSNDAEHERLLARVREANSQLVLAGMDARRRAAELEAALSSIADGVVVYGPDAEILRANREAEALLRLTPESRKLPHAERVRRRHLETEDGKLLDPAEAPVRLALRGETVRGFLMRMPDEEGRSTWISASAAPIRMADGEIIGAIATFSDVTPLRELQQEQERLLEAEREARALAERAVNLRDEFMSVAAHELKTPVTSLLGYSQLLVRQYEKTGVLDPARLIEALRVISQQSRRLAGLTEQLLNASRLEAGKLTISREDTDLASLIEGATGTLRGSRPNREIAVTIHGSGTIPISVDPLRLEQVFINLLDNALKFSPAGSPVEVDVQTDEAACRATVSVRDHGIGVPEDQRERIFERFHQAHEERHYGGMGIGLYVSRHYVEMHGGTLTHEQPEGPGSRFVVHLPLKCED